MKNILLLLCLLAGLAACKKDVATTPVIRQIRNYAPKPGDSLVNTIGPGQWVVISGSNLKGALQIYFDGTQSSFNDALFSDTSAVVLIPSVIAFPLVATGDLNTIRYVTTHGETTFSFKIAPPAPTIISISNENANPGDSVRIYGLNFFFIQNVTYAGTAITHYSGADDGTYIAFIVPPALSQGGIVSVTTGSGTASTKYNVNDVETGVLNNFDDINNYSWGASDITNDVTLCPGGRGNYGRLNVTNVGAYDYAWYNGGRGMNMNGTQWVPVANLGDPVDSWALKVEIYLRTPWSGGTIYMAKDYSFTYIARIEPWRNADGSVTTLPASGWETLTVPLSVFRTNTSTGGDGTGTSAATLSDLLGSGGSGALNIWLINPYSTTVAAFDASFDNMRVVKIK